MNTVYVVWYRDGDYSEDDMILGVYSTEEKANECINKCIRFANTSNERKHFNYSVMERIIDSEPELY